MANVMEPNDLTVARIKKRNTELALVTGLLKNRARIAFGLGEHTLRPERELLGFDNPTDAAAIAKCVIGRPGCRWQFRHGRSCQLARFGLLTRRGGFPTYGGQTGINPGFPGAGLG